MTDLMAELEAEEQDGDLKERIRWLEGQLRRAESKALTGKHVLDTISERVEAALSDVHFKPAPPIRKTKKSQRTPAEAILHCTDWHVGDDAFQDMSVHEAVDNSLDCVDVMRKAHDIDRAVILFGGDIITGETIFKGQVHRITESAYEQACYHAPVLMMGVLRKYLREFKKVAVRFAPGNHGIMHGEQVSPESNWDAVSYRCLELMCDRLSDSDKSKLDLGHHNQWYGTVRTLGWGHILIHGHQVRSWGGIPAYGLIRRALGMTDSVDSPWDYLWAGHFHHAINLSVNQHEVKTTGSLDLDSEYAKERLAAWSPPSQRLAFVTAKRGIICDWPIYVGDHRRSQAERWREWVERINNGEDEV
jgi:hypothetical protein